MVIDIEELVVKSSWHLVILDECYLYKFKTRNYLPGHEFNNKINNFICDLTQSKKNKINSNNSTYFGLVDEQSNEFIGLIELIHINCKGKECLEFGESLYNDLYSGYDIGTFIKRKIIKYVKTLIQEGYPLFTTARLFNIQDQLSVFELQKENEDLLCSDFCIPCGICPHLIIEKDFDGDYFLEFPMAFNSFSAQKKDYKKSILLSPTVLNKKFLIFNPELRPEIEPLFGFPIITKDNQYKVCKLDPNAYFFPQLNYTLPEWEKLLNYCSIFNHEVNDSLWKQSKNQKFLYSDLESPNDQIQIIHIEKINHFDFIQDFDKPMKSINISMQISDFKSEEQECANLALMEILLNSGFVPSAMYDVYYQKEHIRSVLFSNWRDVKVQSKFEVLDIHQLALATFQHDCYQQGYIWPMIVNIIKYDNVLNNNDKNQESNRLSVHFAEISPSTKPNKDIIINFSKANNLQDAFYSEIQKVLVQRRYEMELTFEKGDPYWFNAEFYEGFHDLAEQIESILQDDPMVPEFFIKMSIPNSLKEISIKISKKKNN